MEYPSTYEGNKVPAEIAELVRAFSRLVDTELSTEKIGDTYEIDTDSFSLSFVLEDDTFEIRNIEARETGIGSRVVAAIHAYCDAHELNVFASNVVDTAPGFWKKMGYQEGSTSGEFFRA